MYDWIITHALCNPVHDGKLVLIPAIAVIKLINLFGQAGGHIKLGARALQLGARAGPLHKSDWGLTYFCLPVTKVDHNCCARQVPQLYSTSNILAKSFRQ